MVKCETTVKITKCIFMMEKKINRKGYSEIIKWNSGRESRARVRRTRTCALQYIPVE